MAGGVGFEAGAKEREGGEDKGDVERREGEAAAADKVDDFEEFVRPRHLKHHFGNKSYL